MKDPKLKRSFFKNNYYENIILKLNFQKLKKDRELIRNFYFIKKIKGYQNFKFVKRYFRYFYKQTQY